MILLILILHMKDEKTEECKKLAEIKIIFTGGGGGGAALEISPCPGKRNKKDYIIIISLFKPWIFP